MACGLMVHGAGRARAGRGAERVRARAKACNKTHAHTRTRNVQQGIRGGGGANTLSVGVTRFYRYEIAAACFLL
jgi:hypothetical protein